MAIDRTEVRLTPRVGDYGGAEDESGGDPGAALSALLETARRQDGTGADEDLFGTRRDDVIFGRGGWDEVRGRDGDDILDGGSGSDVIRGGDGRDAIWGGRGKDLLYGGSGADDFFFDTDHAFDLIFDYRGNDDFVVDVSDGAFEGVRERDIDIERRESHDRIYVDGDLVARVYGTEVGYDDIFLVG